jgi:hypothetical protein
VALVCSQLLATAEPDLSLLISMLHGVRADEEANTAFIALTAESVAVKSQTETLIVAHRLRQNKPQYPLYGVDLIGSFSATSDLLMALTASTTLISLTH